VNHGGKTDRSKLIRYEDMRSAALTNHGQLVREGKIMAINRDKAATKVPLKRDFKCKAGASGKLIASASLALS